jgi:thioredoxin 2
MHLVCPACLSINRIPDQRLGEHPRCGRCKHELLDGKPQALGGDAFGKVIGHSGLPVVVDFWAGWCGPCKAMAPVFAQVALDLKERFRFGKVDVDAEPGIAGQFGIASIPTLVLFRNGREVDRVAGTLPAGSLRQWLQARYS